MIFVGLGNPGDKYTGTRHNIGRDLLVRVQGAHPESFTQWKDKGTLKSTYATAHNHITFLLPKTMMNQSGISVRLFANYFGSSPEKIAVVHDDLDLPIGGMKVSFGRGSGGHNGVESVARELGTNAFIRIRVGISPRDEEGNARRPEGEWVASRFVLEQFTEEEKERIFGESHLLRFEELLWRLAQSRLEDVMSQFNARSENDSDSETNSA